MVCARLRLSGCVPEESATSCQPGRRRRVRQREPPRVQSSEHRDVRDRALRCYDHGVRTTYRPAPDVAAAIERLRRESGLGVSEAIDVLARRGMSAKPEPKQPNLPSFHLGARLDITNIGDVLDVLDDAS